jgi:hypothetical protein
MERESVVANGSPANCKIVELATRDYQIQIRKRELEDRIELPVSRRLTKVICSTRIENTRRVVCIGKKLTGPPVPLSNPPNNSMLLNSVLGVVFDGAAHWVLPMGQLPTIQTVMLLTKYGVPAARVKSSPKTYGWPVMVP